MLRKQENVLVYRICMRAISNTAQCTASQRLTFSIFPSTALLALISLCFSALNMMNADLNRFGASGAFLYFVTCEARAAIAIGDISCVGPVMAP